MSGQVLVDFEIQKLIAEGAIRAETPIDPDQIQPNSLDLRVGKTAYRIQASFVPVGSSVVEALADGLATYRIDLDGSDGCVLEPETIYLVPIQEELQLPATVAARVNPKSSTGRLDIFCRAVTNDAPAFDEVAPGYRGPLFLEVVPQSFPIRIRAGDRLSQLRLFEGNPVLSDREVRDELGGDLRIWTQVDGRLAPRTPESIPIREGGILFGVNLNVGKNRTLGYVAKTNLEPIDLRKVGEHATRNYWERLYWEGGSRHYVMLDRGRFYIFASSELISLGPGLCAEMVPYDAGMGEVRSHYAGFFDSGFGWGEANAARIVLEVRNYHVRYRLFHGQTLFRVVIMRNSGHPRHLYGAGDRASNYQGQGLRLAKQFRRTDDQSLDLAQGVLAFDEQG